MQSCARHRYSTGAFFEPLEAELGWTSSQLSTTATINLVVNGLVAPLAATLLERVSMRFAAAMAMGLVSADAGLAVFVSQVSQFRLLWGGWSESALVSLLWLRGRGDEPLVHHHGAGW